MIMKPKKALARLRTTWFDCLLTKFTIEFGIINNKALHLATILWNSAKSFWFEQMVSIRYLQSDTNTTFDELMLWAHFSAWKRAIAFTSYGWGMPSMSKVCAFINLPLWSRIQIPSFNCCWSWKTDLSMLYLWWPYCGLCHGVVLSRWYVI